MSFFGTVDSPRRAFRFWSQGQGDTALKQLLACMIINLIPEEGVDEALEYLGDLFEFHQEEYRYRLPEPQVVRQSTGKVASISQRPDMILSE
jgi:hypothetical protein